MNRQGNCTKEQKQPYVFSVAPDGALHFIYDDPLAPFLDLGDANIKRASHVEPKETLWFADLVLVGGPVLGPYKLRTEALEAEVAWLLENWIPTARHRR